MSNEVKLTIFLYLKSYFVTLQRNYVQNMEALFILFILLLLLIVIPIVGIIRLVKTRRNRKGANNEKCFRINITINED